VGACHPQLFTSSPTPSTTSSSTFPIHRHRVHRRRVRRMRTGGSRPRRTGRAAMPAQPSSPCALGGPSWPLARVSPRRPGRRRHSSPSFFPSSVGADGGPEHHAVIRAPARLTASEAVLDMLTGQLPCCHPHVARAASAGSTPVRRQGGSHINHHTRWQECNTEGLPSTCIKYALRGRPGARGA
jgi:hypothetical protein